MSESSEKKPLSKLERARLAANQSTEQVLQQGEKSLEQLTQQAEQLKQAKIRDAEELALLIEPLCQTLLQLTEDTRQTFQALQREAKSAQEQRTKDQESYKQELETLSQNFQKRIENSTENYNKAAHRATSAARELEVAGQRLELSHYLIAALVSLAATLCSNVFVQWLYPPKIENNLQLNTETLLQALKQEQELFLGPPQNRPEKPSKNKR